MGERLRAVVRWGVRTLTPGDGLRNRTITGGVWVTLSGALDRGLQLGMVVVLARLLDPAAFGLMGISLLVLAGLYQVTNLGVDSALIQREEANVDAYLDTAWSLGLVRGLGLGAAVFALAPVVGSAFDAPRSVDLIRALALAPPLVGLVNPGVVYFRKDLDFHRECAYGLSARVVQVLVTIGYALVFGTVWALVIGHLAKQLVAVIVSYGIHDYRPRPTLDREYARELLGYGRWIFASMLLAFLGAQGDDAFVAWALGAPALGLYQVAYRFSNAPATEVTHTLSTVLFPTYARLQDDIDTLRRGYLDTLQLTAIVTFPAAVGLAAVAPQFVRGVFGSEWAGMVLPLQVLAAYGLARSLRSTTVPLFRAIDRPQYETYVRVLKLVVIVVLIYPLTTAFGLSGAALAVLASACVAGPVAGYLTLSLLDCRVRDPCARLAFPVVGSAMMGVCVLAVGEAIVLSPSLELLVLIPTGVVVYGTVMVGMERRYTYGAGRLVHTVREGIQ